MGNETIYDDVMFRITAEARFLSDSEMNEMIDQIQEVLADLDLSNVLVKGIPGWFDFRK